jgi:hypothetical protein
MKKDYDSTNATIKMGPGGVLDKDKTLRNMGSQEGINTS